MKKRYFWYASMLLAALSLVLTACNQGVTAGNGTGTVQVVIGGGAARSVYPDSRMPVFDNENTTIIVSKKDGTVLKRGTTAVTLTLDIGTKIIVKAVVKTKAGEWRGSAEHTVTAGTNTVAVRLSQLPMSMGNILIDVNAAQTEVTLKLTSGKELLNGVQIGHNYMTPVTARDGKGRIYVLYHKSGFRFTRFDADGELDSEFETAIMAKLPSGISASIMAVDAKTNTIFVVDVAKHVYAVTETSHNVFTCSSGFDLAGLSAIGSYDTIQTGAAYDGVLFLAVKAASTSKLLACKADITGTGFTLIEKNTAQLPKLRNSLVMSVDTKCTGLFADAKGVYCLLQEQKLDGGSVYAVGSFVHYTYDAEVLTEKAVAGLNPNAADTARPSLAYDDDFFSSPAGFIGYDEKYIYIADDGVDIKDDTYIGWCVTGNKNRIIPFDRNAETVSFDSASSAPAWFTEYTGYQYAAKIPNLLWTKKSNGRVKLDLKTADGTVKELVPEINDVQRKILTTARDSTGSVYVLYYDGSASSLHLERFAADGTKDTSFGTAKSGFTLPDTSVTDIAVDFKTADVFLLKRTALPAGSQLTAYMAKKTDTGYTSFSTAQTVNLPSIPSGGANIDSVAAFDGTLFVAMDVQGSPNQKKLYAYKMETASIGAFSLSTSPAEVPFPELRAGASKKTRCTGLFADRQGVYALLTQQDPYPGIAPYAFGQMVRYSYNGTTLAEGAQKGLNPAASGTGPVKYESQYLSNPVGFIGYDGDTLYFADDGANIEYINENYRLNGDKDRIMAFNRKDNTVSDPSIGGDGAAWFENYNEYKKPNTKVLLWENTGGNIMKYWLGDNGSTPYPGDADALWASTSSSGAPTDVFCYDQDGNLYILWTDGLNYKVRRFALQKDGSYKKPGVNSATIGTGPRTPQYIAVDISDGQNRLYYGNKDGTWWVSEVRWGNTFAAWTPGSEKTLVSTITGDITALAANRDGVFVGVQTVDTLSVPPRYMLSVKKYTKSDGASAGEITIGAPETIPTIPGSPYPDYTKSDHTITGLQVVDRVLYAITSKLEEKMVYNSDLNGYGIDEFKSSGILYKVAETAASFSGSAEMLDEKNPVSPPPGNNTGVGYGFYRFIAVKPKKLIIASNGACAVGGNASGSQTPPPDPRSDNKVVTYNLEGSLNPSEVDAGGKFYKKLTPGSGFAWE